MAVKLISSFSPQHLISNQMYVKTDFSHVHFSTYIEKWDKKGWQEETFEENQPKKFSRSYK